MAFISIYNLILRSADRLRSPNQTVIVQIRNVWQTVLDDLSVKSEAQPTSVVCGTLRLDCSSLSEAAYLRPQKEAIKKALNKQLPPDKQICDVDFLTKNQNVRTQ